jgi:hypothetical protein
MKEYVESVDNCDCCPNMCVDDGLCLALDRVIYDHETEDGEFPEDCPLDDY